MNNMQEMCMAALVVLVASIQYSAAIDCHACYYNELRSDRGNGDVIYTEGDQICEEPPKEPNTAYRTSCHGACTKLVAKYRDHSGEYQGLITARGCENVCSNLDITGGDIDGTADVESWCCSDKDYCNAATRHVGGASLMVYALAAVCGALVVAARVG